jgi:hypothetical protein
LPRASRFPKEKGWAKRLRRLTGERWNHRGLTREVILTRRYAIKLPKLSRGWQLFRHGIRSNAQEREFAGRGWAELCPVVFALPGGWLVVMRRARPLTHAEWEAFDAAAFCGGSSEHALDRGRRIPVELKKHSFGVLDGRIVAVDYGS